MATWAEVAASAPEFAATVQAIFDAHKHKTLATLRKDGAPRISGIEAGFVAGNVVLGMMPGSLKARDLQRDPRLALHSASVDPPEDATKWQGDAKLAGRAVEITDPAEIERFGQPPDQPAHLFVVDLSEVVLTYVGDPPDHLVIELWRPGQALRRFERR